MVSPPSDLGESERSDSSKGRVKLRLGDENERDNDCLIPGLYSKYLTSGMAWALISKNRC